MISPLWSSRRSRKIRWFLRCATGQSVVTERRNAGISAAITILFIWLFSCEQAGAQTFQFLPEVDAYYRMHPNIRFTFQAKETREAGEPTRHFFQSECHDPATEK